MLTAIFAARPSVLARLLPRPSVQPAVLGPGLSAVTLTLLDVHDSDVGPHRELVVGVPTMHAPQLVPELSMLRQARTHTFPIFVERLFVSTERAREAASDVFGLPGTLAAVAFNAAEGRFEMTIGSERGPVLALAGEVPAERSPSCTLRFLACSLRQGRLVETQMLVRAEALDEARGPRHARLRLDLDHPLGAAVGESLVASTPLLVQWSRRVQSVLYPPVLLE